MDLDFWGLAAGDIDQGFVAYVLQNDSVLHDYFTIYDNYYWYRSNGEIIDIPHLAATYNIYHFDTLGSLGSYILPENWIDNLGGWAGDLRSLIPYVLRDTNYSTSYNEIYNQAMSQIGGSIENSHFSLPDLLADVDAYNLFNNINTSSLKNTFNNYYSNGIATRYTDFTNGWSKTQIFNLTKDMITNIIINNENVWPLKKVDAIGNKTSEDLTLSDTQVDAICSAFTDYLWAKITME